MPHSIYIAGGGQLPPAPFCIFGIVNATPDSFFDGKGRLSNRLAVRRARRVWNEGAQVLDIGGESTRPYAPTVSHEEECARILPVIKAASGFRPRQGASPVLSIDTRNAFTAAQSLEAGAHIINDVSGCADPAMPEVLAQYKPGYVLMHTQGSPENMQDNPRYTNIVDELLNFFDQAMHSLTRAGLPENRILLDPGIGFGKHLEHNLEILRNLHRFAQLDRPMLLGISMKSLFKDLLNLPVTQRGAPTQILTALAFRQGIRFHRVHHVAKAVQALTIAQAVDITS